MSGQTKGNRPVALVTGAGRGIGLGIARCLAAGGFDVAVGDIHEESVVSDALRELGDLGAETLYCRADVSDAAARAAMVSEIKRRFGKLNVLVNNAGVAPTVRADITEATEESFERLIRINLQGPFFLTQAVAVWMLEQRQGNAGFRGCIINISSVSATVASPSRGEYCISKAGVSMATKLWAARLGEADIPVYEIRPGIIRTDMTAGVKDKYDKLIAGGLTRQKRWGTPDDVGKAAAMLARGDLSYSTGQAILVDGGMTVDVL